MATINRNITDSMDMDLGELQELSSWFEICPPFISIQAKVEKKTEAAAPARKPEPNAVTKAAGPIGNAQKPPTGKVSFI